MYISSEEPAHVSEQHASFERVVDLIGSAIQYASTYSLYDFSVRNDSLHSCLVPRGEY